MDTVLATTYDKKSVSGGHVMVGGCRLHNHSRTTGQYAFGSGESEIMRVSELLKEAKVTQHNLEFCGVGPLPVVLHTDADVARAFCLKRGVGRMKHLNVRHCWKQEELQSGSYSVMRFMLTHSPSAEENCESSFPMIGCHTMTVKRDNSNAVKTILKAMLAAKVTAFLASMAETLEL